MEQDLVIRRVWAARQGRAAISPSEASEAFTQDYWQAAEVIAAPEPDRFFSLLWAGEEAVRVHVLDPAEHVASGCTVDGIAAPERAGA
ncbi:hypothetical protein QFZ79_000292 [Arthrobacter sp. V4I6]|uniref:hypothetical protein n=1 Tax=Arthrobacter sp. V4I6 TaxID=3042281 RepID=UPI00278657BE|nr:hypothetical protein [Arthrobacter sp. V4I6]MDQ0822553.1 hypothetical protein [Arthrobacter sp. V1I7]MDQ0852181.1 hypothetical protein [Arthrobacter sp. V4I6]